jgi:hypothetical protein
MSIDAVEGIVVYLSQHLKKLVSIYYKFGLLLASYVVHGTGALV